MNAVETQLYDARHLTESVKNRMNWIIRKRSYEPEQELEKFNTEFLEALRKVEPLHAKRRRNTVISVILSLIVITLSITSITYDIPLVTTINTILIAMQIMLNTKASKCEKEISEIISDTLNKWFSIDELREIVQVWKEGE